MNTIVLTPADAPIRPRPVPSHRAAYLILLGPNEGQKALLFNADHRYLSEVIDDGFIVDTLRTAGTPCAKPGTISLDGMLAGRSPLKDADVLCFALGKVI